GTMHFGTRLPATQSREILDAYLDLGGQWIDTANCYAFWGAESGLGWFAAQLGDLQMAAIVSVNAMGDVYDPSSGQKLAGMMTDDRTAWIDAEDYMAQLYRASRTKTDAQEAESGAAVQNTTIGAVVTNAAFSKPQMNKIAAMTLNAYARCIRPVATMSDGDTVYAASIGKLQADINLAGSLAAQVMQQAIIRAVTKSRISDEEYLAKAAL
ncbi:MAG: aldo/keto reductase, partial [Eubacterium sp.]